MAGLHAPAISGKDFYDLIFLLGLRINGEIILPLLLCISSSNIFFPVTLREYMNILSTVTISRFKQPSHELSTTLLTLAIRLDVKCCLSVCNVT